MHARGKLALALSLSLIVGTLEAAPWERADSKIQPDNSPQTRRSTRAHSYSPPATTPTVAQPATQPRTATQAPMTQRMPSAAPRTQPAPIATVAPTTVAPTTVAPTTVAPTTVAPSTRAPLPVVPRQPATSYVPNQSRGYRSYSYQPSTGNRSNYNMRSPRRVPFYMRADSKILGRQGF